MGQGRCTGWRWKASHLAWGRSGVPSAIVIKLNAAEEKQLDRKIKIA